MGYSSYRDHYRSVRQQAAVLEQQAELLGRMSETLSSGNEFSVRVTDRTLEPWILPGDVMIFKATNFERINLGDFVLYRLNNGAPAVRRVVDKGIFEGHASLFTRSDKHQNRFDLIRASQVLARMLCIERYERTIPASHLSRGIADRLTHYGTLNPLLRCVELCLCWLPVSVRPQLARLKGEVTRVEAPTLDRKKDSDRGETRYGV